MTSKHKSEDYKLSAVEYYLVGDKSQEVFKKYTGIFAISYNGVLGWDLYEKGGIDSDRLYEFLEKHITTKYKNKLIILDNASSHRNAKIKELVNKHNTLLYSVPYQHFTNSIENYFSMMKSRLYKLDGRFFCYFLLQIDTFCSYIVIISNIL